MLTADAEYASPVTTYAPGPSSMPGSVTFPYAVPSLVHSAHCAAGDAAGGAAAARVPPYTPHPVASLSGTEDASGAAAAAASSEPSVSSSDLSGSSRITTSHTLAGTPVTVTVSVYGPSTVSTCWAVSRSCTGPT